MRRHRYLTIALFACALVYSPKALGDDSADPLSALMMGGTGAPTPSIEWQDRIIAAYVDPATGGNTHQCWCQLPNPRLIRRPPLAYRICRPR